MTGPAVGLLSMPRSMLAEEQQAAESEVAFDPQAQHKERLRRLRGPEYPGQDAQASVKAAYVRQLITAGDADAMARYRQATKNMAYHAGRMHITWSNRSRSWEDIPLLDPGELRVVMNYLRPILRATSQRMLSAPVDFSCRPSDNSHEEKDRAEVGARFLNSRWEQTGMRAIQEQALDQAYSSGVVAWKGFWNPAIGPLTAATIRDVQVDPATGEPRVVEVYVDENGQPVETEAEAHHYRPGDTDTAIRTIFNIRVNPEATGWTTGQGLRWLIDREVVPVSVAKEKFEAIADQIVPQAVTDSSLTYERIAASSATQRPVVAGTSATAGTAQRTDVNASTVITEYWELPSSCYPKGRLLVLIGDAEAYDGVFPQDVFPYVPVFDEPAPLTAYGRPRVNDMTGPSDLINRQWTAIDAEMQMAGIGQVIAWDVEGVPDQVTNANRVVIKIPARGVLANKSLSEIMHRMPSAQVPSDRWRILAEAKSALFDVGGFHEVSRGQTPPGVDSGVAIQHLLEQEAGQLQKAILALKASIIQWGRVQGALAKWGYHPDAGRWMPVSRGDLGYQVESVKGTDLPDFQTLTIELDNFRPMSGTARRAELKELYESKMISAQQVLKGMDLGTGANAFLDSQNRHYSRARAENLAIQKGEYQVLPTGPEPLDEMGRPMGPPPDGLWHLDQTPFVLSLDDDHVLHMDVHDELLLDDSQPRDVRQAVMTHKAEHRAALQALQPPAVEPDMSNG